MLARRSLILGMLVVLFLLLASVASCDATLTVLESTPAGDGKDAAGEDASALRDVASEALADAYVDADAPDAWPGPPGTVVEIATGLVGAADIDVDDAFVYVLVGGQRGALTRVAKRGGAPESVATDQTYPSSVRVTPSAVVWSLAPGMAPEAATIMQVPRAGGSPSPLLVGGNNAGKLAADGERVVWVDSFGALGRVVLADLALGSKRPILENELGIGGFAIEGDRVVWTAKCHANVCGGFVMGSSISAPAPAPLWSTTSNVSMGGIALSGGAVSFGYFAASASVAHFARLAPGASQPVDYQGDVHLASPLRRDGDFLVGLSQSPSALSLIRVRADGTAPPVVLEAATGTSGAVAVDASVVYWISTEEGVLRAIAR